MGTAYTFRVRAANSEGTSAQSAASNSVTPTSAGVPAAPTGVSAAPDSEAAVVRWTAPNDGGSPLTNYTVTPYLGGSAQTPVTVNAPATRATVTGLSTSSSYTFRVRANNAQRRGRHVGRDERGDAAALDLRASRRRPPSTPATAGAVELGVRFSSSAAGSISGVRFYKASANTGTHVGSLWTESGTLLAQANFTGEDASGWQTVLFTTPVPIAADTTYIAGYHAPNGHYSVASRAFDGTPFSNPPLSALADGSAGNGLYRYTATPAVPTNSFNASNYFVDVLYRP